MKVCEECEYIYVKKPEYLDCLCCGQSLCKQCWQKHLKEYHEDYEYFFEYDGEIDGQTRFEGKTLVHIEESEDEYLH